MSRRGYDFYTEVAQWWYRKQLITMILSQIFFMGVMVTWLIDDRTLMVKLLGVQLLLIGISLMCAFMSRVNIKRGRKAFSERNQNNGE